MNVDDLAYYDNPYDAMNHHLSSHTHYKCRICGDYASMMAPWLNPGDYTSTANCWEMRVWILHYETKHPEVSV